MAVFVELKRIPNGRQASGGMSAEFPSSRSRSSALHTKWIKENYYDELQDQPPEVLIGIGPRRSRADGGATHPRSTGRQVLQPVPESQVRRLSGSRRRANASGPRHHLSGKAKRYFADRCREYPPRP